MKKMTRGLVVILSEAKNLLFFEALDPKEMVRCAQHDIVRSGRFTYFGNATPAIVLSSEATTDRALSWECKAATFGNDPQGCNAGC